MKTPEQARKEGFNVVASKPKYAPANPYGWETLEEELLHNAWNDGADEAGINSSYTNGILDR